MSERLLTGTLSLNTKNKQTGLICSFVFAYAKSSFSHDMAQSRWAFGENGRINFLSILHNINDGYTLEAQKKR